MYSIQEYAQDAGISARAVRLRIARGAVPAEKVGGTWVIADVGRARPRQKQGRRLSSRSFDLLADLLDGEGARLSPDERRRAQHRARRIADGGLRQVREFGRRPGLEIRTFRAGPEDLRELAADARLSATGLMHPQAEVYGSMVDAYVSSEDADEIELFHLLEPAANPDSNVRLRIQSPRPQVRRLHVIADLLDDHSPRSRAEAERLLQLLTDEVR